MARSAKTVYEHMLNGTPVKVSGVSNVPPGRPRFPAHLSRAARTECKRVCQLLEQRHCLTPADASILAMYGEVYARWVEAKKELQERGLFVDLTFCDNNGVAFTRRDKNPALKVCTDAERQLLAILRTMGLTGIDKDKVKPAKVEREADEAEDFLGGKGTSPILLMPVRHGEVPE